MEENEKTAKLQEETVITAAGEENEISVETEAIVSEEEEDFSGEAEETDASCNEEAEEVPQETDNYVRTGVYMTDYTAPSDDALRRSFGLK